MPRNITVTFKDGSTHVYQNAPDDITPEQVTQRASQEFKIPVVGLDGGRSPSIGEPTRTTIDIRGGNPNDAIEASKIARELDNPVTYADKSVPDGELVAPAAPVETQQPQVTPEPVSRTERFATGIDDPISGLAQFAGRVVPGLSELDANISNLAYDKTGGKKFLGMQLGYPEKTFDEAIKKREADYQKRREAGGDGGFDAYRLTGNILSPVNLAAISKIPGAVGTAGKVLTGAGAGALAGAENPVYGDDFVGEKALQIGTGTVLGTGGATALKAIERLRMPSREIGQVVRGITQNADRTDTPSLTNALAETIPKVSKKAKTPELLDVTKQGIAENTAKVDEVLSKDLTPMRAADLTIDTQVGDKIVATPYVKDALSQMEDYYRRVNLPDKAEKTLLEIKKMKESGLNALEVNQIAREHSQLFNAFKANGELSDSVTKTAWENTRNGVKKIARNMIGDPEAQALDAKTYDLYNLKGALEKRLGKFDVADAKAPINNPIVNALSTAAGYADTKTGKTISGLVRGALKGKNASLNAVDLEERLAKDIKDFRKLAKKNNAFNKRGQ